MNGPVSSQRRGNDPGSAAVEESRWILPGLLACWLVAIPTDRFFRLTGELRHFGVTEQPFLFAHDAARFAGTAGMPDRALVFDIGQASVYLYHNGPRRKLFMDARLEVPRLETFNTYRRVEQWLHAGNPRWAEAVHGMGDPLILISHEENGDSEATILADPRWRCVWFDPVAAIFLPRNQKGPEELFPTVDFGNRQFAGSPVPTPGPVAALVEARALAEMGSALSKRAGTRWVDRLPILLLGSRLAKESMKSQPGSATPWTVLGHCCWSLAPDLSARPPGLDDPWELAESLSWAQTTFCYRRALERAPDNIPALLSMAGLFEVRRMTGAKRAVADRIRAIRGQALDSGSRTLEQITAEAEGTAQVLSWTEAERRGTAVLNLGDPDRARRIWEHAENPPSPAIRLARIADTHLTALEFETAECGIGSP